MKQKLGLCLLITMLSVFIAPNVKAVTATFFGSTTQEMTTGTTTENGNSISIENKNENTKLYLGANVTAGTLTTYKVHIDFSSSNFSYKSLTRQSGWAAESGFGRNGVVENEDGSIDISLTNATGITGRKLVATINLNVSDAAPSTEKCTIKLSVPEEKPEVVTPKCQIVDNKYYDKNGNVVTKEAYEESCPSGVENPQTGNFLPYTVIIAGAVVAIGLYLVTKKNAKIYHV